MSPETKATLFSGFLGFLGAGVATFWPRRAGAAAPVPGVPVAEPPPAPSPPDAPAAVQDAVAPRSEFPWMAYSFRTQQIQQAINQWRDITGQPRITVDGVLGPQTCQAWWQWYRGDDFASIVPPRSCNAYP